MLEEQLIKIFAAYLGVDTDDINETTNILYAFDLDEDQLEELADIIVDETGKYVSADMIEAYETIEQLAREMEDY